MFWHILVYTCTRTNQLSVLVKMYEVNEDWPGGQSQLSHRDCPKAAKDVRLIGQPTPAALISYHNSQH